MKRKIVLGLMAVASMVIGAVADDYEDALNSMYKNPKPMGKVRKYPIPVKKAPVPAPKETVKAKDLKVKIVYEPMFNYFLVHLGDQLVKSITVTNNGNTATPNLLVTVKLSPDDYAGEWTQTIPSIGAGKSVTLRNIHIPIRHKAFKEVEERLSAALVVTIKDSKETLYASTSKVDILAFNEWFLDPENIENLCAFVRPNSAAVKKIVSMSRKRLKEVSGIDSFEDYQAGDPMRVLAMLTAIHRTMNKDLDIGYITVPASFEKGQKIRSHDDVLKYKQGTCLDLAVLEAAIWENAGLHPVIIIIPGHAFVACWLKRKNYPAGINVIQNAGSAKKVMAPVSAHDLLIMNSTTVTNDGERGMFKRAVLEGNAIVASCLKKGKWLIFIDVSKCRRNKDGKSVKPLPF